MKDLTNKNSINKVNYLIIRGENIKTIRRDIKFKELKFYVDGNY